MNDELKTVFEQLASRRDLTRGQSRRTFERIMSGQLTDSVTAALLGALMVKGESVDELVGAAEAMRAAAIPIRCDAECIDTCGTGGDGVSTFNVSTAAAIIAAAAGATVAKHGNRSTTRVSGSTEVLTRLGIDVDAPPAIVERSLREVRIGYLNARQLHPAMKFAAPVRAAIPARTIFNLLGPLTNPAGALRQLVGVPGPGLTETIALALFRLGAIHAWVVHGDGLCDLTITGETSVVEVRGGRFRRFRIQPEDVGLCRAPLEALRVGSPEDSADAIMGVLRREAGPRRDHTLLNAGAALVVAGRADDLRTGVEQAARTIDEGAALSTLDRWRAIAGLSDGAKARAGGET